MSFEAIPKAIPEPQFEPSVSQLEPTIHGFRSELEPSMVKFRALNASVLGFMFGVDARQNRSRPS